MFKTVTDGNGAASYISYALSELAIIYPITPSSPMAELADEWQAAEKENIFGLVPQVVEMQSEAGAAGAVHGALTCGALATTYTCSQGLLMMIPNMYKIAGELLPTVFHVSARAIATHALSIFGDHQDVMACRQTGFAMLCSSSVQETADLALIAHLCTLASSIPFLHFFDGFRTSHELSKIELPDYDEMKALFPAEDLNLFRARALTPEHPIQRGTTQNPDVYFQNRERSNKRYLDLPSKLQAVMDKAAILTKRAYHVFDYYGAKDAEQVIVMMGSGTQTAEETIDELLAHGAKVGLVNVRLYRPFDKKRFCDCLPKSCQRVAVLDRTKENGSAGEPLYLDVCAALGECGRRDVLVVGGRYGLGQKEFTPADVQSVFKNLQTSNPKNAFTVGIHDDVTCSSLERVEFSVKTPQQVACKFFGLGSDGTVGANKNSIKIIGEQTPMFVQGYFEYDSKKSGGVTISHLRFGEKPIRSEYGVEEADFVACHNTSYLTKYDMVSCLKVGATFLLNCPWRTLEELNAYLPHSFRQKLAKKHARFYVIDGEKIASEVGLNGKHSAVMQAAFFLTCPNLMPYEKAVAEMKKLIESKFAKKGKEIVERNFTAIDRVKDELIEIEVPESWNFSDIPPTQAVETTQALNSIQEAQFDSIPQGEGAEYYQLYIQPILALKGNDLPVSAFSEDGSVPTGTTQWEKHGVAQSIPRWIKENCIQCNQCSFVCPHACIRPFVADSEHLEGAPSGFETIPANGFGSGNEGMQFRIQVSLHDCMGCGLCARVCPAKEKALVMTDKNELPDKEGENWDFATKLPPLERSKFNTQTVKGSQFATPLFEFSYACAGCGETAYIKLLTQLFGERLLIANATGCSSIYGGSSPTCPYSKAQNGRGPAWANSLFEDNAEFGLGMRLAQECHGSTERSTWCIGGDGWAYDIGYGGLDHVLASGKNVNVLVLDSEVYSNTGGQASKATPTGATARFATKGKALLKKRLGLMAITHKNVYVAQVALGANMAQTLKALQEAEAYDGPSLVIAYCPCIAHGVSMSRSLDEQMSAVASGYWNLFRYNPALRAEGKKAFTLDSKAPTLPLREFLRGENRFASLEKSNPARAEELFAKAENECKELRAIYERLAEEL